MPFLPFFGIFTLKNLKLAYYLKGFHLRIALSLQKYALFIHTVDMPYLAKIYSEPFPVFAKRYIIDDWRDTKHSSTSVQITIYSQ